MEYTITFTVSLEEIMERLSADWLGENVSEAHIKEHFDVDVFSQVLNEAWMDDTNHEMWGRLIEEETPNT